MCHNRGRLSETSEHQQDLLFNRVFTFLKPSRNKSESFFQRTFMPAASDALWCLDSRLFEQKALCYDKEAADGPQMSAYFQVVSLLLFVNFYWQIEIHSW